MRWSILCALCAASLLLAGCEEPVNQQALDAGMRAPPIDPATFDRPSMTDLHKQVVAKDTEIESLKQQLQVLREAIQRAQGKSAGMVDWVDLNLKSAMVNLGSSDGMAIDSQFAVYSSDADLPELKLRRGVVKVNKVIGPHLSEAEIVEVNKELPIRAGDRVYELSSTGADVKPDPLDKQAPKEKSPEETLKQLEQAFENEQPLKLPANP